MLTSLLLALLAASPAAASPPVPAPDPLDQAKAVFEHRLDPRSLDQAIIDLDKIPGAQALVVAARAHRFRATAFLLRKRPFDRERGLADLEQARARALQAWELVQTGVTAKVNAGELESVLKVATVEAEPALLERAESDLALAGWRGPLGAVPLLREALSLANRATQLDATLNQAAPHRIRAAALAALPASAGGDLKESRFAFERAVAFAPRALNNRVEMAARYAVKAQNRTLFHALLKEALRLDVDALPEFRPEQLIARTRALALLHRERELFRG